MYVRDLMHYFEFRIQYVLTSIPINILITTRSKLYILNEHVLDSLKLFAVNVENPASRKYKRIQFQHGS